MVRWAGVEPATKGLKGPCSTTELPARGQEYTSSFEGNQALVRYTLLIWRSAFGMLRKLMK